jgi:hypothetical protein
MITNFSAFFNRWFFIVANHRVVLGVAVAISLIYGSQHLWLSYFNERAGWVYQPVAIKNHFDEGYYAIRASRSFAGDLLVGDPVIKEQTNTPAALAILNPNIIALLGKLSGSFKNGLIVSDFFLPPIIFLLVYLIAFELTGRRRPSLFFAVLFIVAPRFGVWPSPGALPFFSGAKELYFSRFDYPAVTFPFFALAMYLLARLMKKPSLGGGLLFGFATGVLLYTYFYDFVYMVLVGVLFFIGAALSREYRLCHALIASLPAAIFVSLFYWLNFFKLKSLPAFMDIIERIGIERGRRWRGAPVWFSYIRAIFFTVLSGWLFRFRDKNKFIFLSALVLPIIFLLNIQVITGFVPQPDHWHRITFLGLALSVFVCSLEIYDRYFHSKVKYLFRFGGTVVTVVFLVYAFLVQWAAAKADFTFYRVDPAYAAAYQWIIHHTRPDAVIGALSPLTNDELVMITGRFVYLPNGFLSLVSTDEIWLRLMEVGKMYNLDNESWRAYVAQNVLHFFADQYGSKEFNAYFGRFQRLIPEKILSRATTDYLTFKFPKPSFDFDYALIGPREEAFGATARVDWVKVYDQFGVAIYSVNSQK